MPEPAPDLQYAGFWSRVFATVGDGVLFWGLGMLLSTVAAELIFEHMGLFLVGQVAAHWLYNAGMESSSKQATLGKLALGIRVGHLDGSRIGFWTASGRWALRLLSAMPWGLGFLPVAFTQRKQAMHDFMMRTIVICAPSNEGSASEQVQ